MVLHEFMDDANIKSGSKQAETIMNWWVENKMPYTKQHGENDPWPRQPERAYFQRGEDFPASPDTLGIKKGNINDWIAELAHAIQYNVPSSVRDSLSEETKIQKDKFGELVYGKEMEYPKSGSQAYPIALADDGTVGMAQYVKDDLLSPPTVEFEAHSIIEPPLVEKYSKAQFEDLAKEYPLSAKIIKYLQSFNTDESIMDYLKYKIDGKDIKGNHKH